MLSLLELSKRGAQTSIILSLSLFQSPELLTLSVPSYTEHLDYETCCLQMLSFLRLIPYPSNPRKRTFLYLFSYTHGTLRISVFVFDFCT